MGRNCDQTDLTSLAGLPAVPESALSAEDLAALPEHATPAPWECRVHAVIWAQRARHPRFGWLGSPLPLAVTCFVDYLDTPVGPYREVLVSAVLRRGLLIRSQIPFIAVDSLASVLGGRANWGLPKTMAGFTMDLPAADARGDGWSVSVTPSRTASRRRWAGRFQVRARFSSIGPLGTYQTKARGHGRLMRVRTDAQGETLTGWLGGGTHLALEWTGTMRIVAPVPDRG